MKLALAVFLSASAFAILHSSFPAKRPIGPCEPYAETCRHCSDCSTCKHCSVKGGTCSVCLKR